LVVPQRHDQPYWAERAASLGIGVAHPGDHLSVDSLSTALSHAMEPSVGGRARSLAPSISTDGTRVAAELVLAEAA
jgi:UDP:flavonoid glycosyltransferase YjiC (YdhE family)